MNRMRISLGFVCIAIVLLSGCGVETVTLTRDDGGCIESVGLGALISIRLDGNASTGYAWTRVTPEIVPGLPIEILQEGAYITDTGIPGSPGVYAFDYHAMQRGTITLGFAYKRPWEESAIDAYTVTIWVQ